MSKVDCRRRLRNQIPVSFLNKFVVHVLLLKDQDGLMLMVKFEWNLNEISRKFGSTHVRESYFAALIGYQNFFRRVFL